MNEEYNYKVYFTWKKRYKDIKGKEKIEKQNTKLAFDYEPSDYDIECKLKDYIKSMERFMSDLKIRLELEEISKIQRLKVAKGSKDSSAIDEMSDYFGL
ncbi:hypothetical protein LJC30_02715 [Odoribacter sp. OttesenSCG-928-L07]|nr:hypothetical protein [Odoribacter sp. OttesenSCG-928-L07]MDL2238943.1 hypothetical protein [Bacteroidales bacterium OttesenSCG-928-L14]